MKKSGIWIVAIGCAVVLTVLLSAIGRSQKSADPMVGQAAPAITLKTIARESARTPQSEMTLINFWATWCPPCLAEHPVLMELADNGVNVVGVAYRDDPDRIRAYLETAGDPFSTLYFDSKGDVLADYGTRGVPETFLIDADGKILWRVSGPLVPEIYRRELLPQLKR